MDCYPGDNVRLRASFTHNDCVIAVEVVYANVDDPTCICVLEGNPDLDEGSPTIGKDKRSTVTLTGVFDAAHPAGLYRMQRLVLYTFVGNAIFDTPHAGLGEVEWPVIELHIPTHSINVTRVELDPGT